ncbi:MAG: CCA tRNA nucleotidyltransferase, partial [Proteobacteria bacterium]|nr:CCA tRNA nucleotidyltransferase [Pseudomonadota bacterium]
DYFGGQADARMARVRFIGDATARVREDYLRILRFYRFHAHYGGAAPDAEGLAACEAAAEKLSGISGERVQAELLKLLAAPAASATLLLMARGGVLAHALSLPVEELGLFARLEAIEALGVPALAPEMRLSGFVLGAPGDPLTALALIAKRLRLSLRVEKSLRAWLPYVPQMQKNLPLAEQKHLLRLLGAAPFTALVLMSWAFSEDEIGAKSPYLAMLKLAREWQPPIFPVSGADLIEVGIAPGRVMGDVLRQLQDLWERADYALSKDELIVRARAQHQTDNG